MYQGSPNCLYKDIGGIDLKILFAGGGTAGHINPALAIANKLSEEIENTEIKFVGTKEGLEVSLIPHSGYPLETIKVHGFERKLSFGTIKTLAELPNAVIASRRIIKKFNPDVVIGTGGYVCGPVLYAAAKMKIPTFVHESNAFPGITTKLLSKYVDTVAIGIDAARGYLPSCKNTVFTGNPIRASILTTDSFAARRKLKLDERPFVLIFGGSLGAKDFDAAAAKWICKVAESGKYQILMGTGKLNQYDDVLKIFEDNGVNIDDYDNINVCEYIYDMDVVMNAADLVISRAGASTLAELTAIGKPAILVPSPYVTDNHQEHNARAVESVGGAKVIIESELTADAIDEAVASITENPTNLAEMGKASSKMGVRNSADIIYREIMKLV